MTNVGSGTGAEARADLAPRYDPGADIGPLVRGLGGGLLGGVAGLAIDRIIPSPSATAWLLPGLVSGAVGGSEVAAAAVWLLSAGLAGLVLAYGRFRRFVPGPPWATGLAWGGAVWLAAGPAVLAPWSGPPGAEGAALMAAATAAWAETVVCFLVFGLIAGVLDPRAT